MLNFKVEQIKNKGIQSALIIGAIDPEEIRIILDVDPADYQLMDEESIKIEGIRQLLHWLNLTPMGHKKKLVVIHHAENMTIESANALLKTLEEPPTYAQIILTTMNEQRILPTIQSRCQKIRLASQESESLPELYLSPDQIAKINIKERFAWVAKISELSQGEILGIITAWQVFFRQSLLKGENKIPVLKALGSAKDLLQTNISVKLLLENVVLKF